MLIVSVPDYLTFKLSSYRRMRHGNFTLLQISTCVPDKITLNHM